MLALVRCALVSWSLIVWKLELLPDRRLLLPGYRMPVPASCPNRYYHEVMMQCWEYEAVRRPKFSDLVRMTDMILKTV